MTNPREGKSFSNNEVMALVEEFKNSIQLIAEDTSSIREDMKEVKERLESVETKLKTVEDAVRITLPNHEKRISKIEAKVGV